MPQVDIAYLLKHVGLKTLLTELIEELKKQDDQDGIMQCVVMELKSALFAYGARYDSENEDV